MINERYVWMVWATSFLVPWVVLWLICRPQRRAMLWASIFTTPFGLTEPLFVPEYWNPPSLFNLAARTGFDIESQVFCFGIGGVGAVAYNVLTGARFDTMTRAERDSALHRHHYKALLAPFAVFPLLWLLPVNPIYPAVVAMIVGSAATLLCRPDLASKTWIGGLVFTVYYSMFVIGLQLLSPGYVARVWNLEALSGYLVLGIPLEELVFAMTFGTYWSGVYEHFHWRRPTSEPEAAAGAAGS